MAGQRAVQRGLCEKGDADGAGSEQGSRSLSLYNYTLTGMGINPYRIYNQNIPVPNGRYRMLFHHLHSYTRYRTLPMYFHPHPEFGTFSSASQVQLDIKYEEIPEVINTFSLLEPLKARIFSNSVLLGEAEDYLCYRDILWENSNESDSGIRRTYTNRAVAFPSVD